MWFDLVFISGMFSLDYKATMILSGNKHCPYKLIHSAVLAVFQILTKMIVVTGRWLPFP